MIYSTPEQLIAEEVPVITPSLGHGTVTGLHDWEGDDYWRPRIRFGFGLHGSRAERPPLPGVAWGECAWTARDLL